MEWFITFLIVIACGIYVTVKTNKEMEAMFYSDGELYLKKRCAAAKGAIIIKRFYKEGATYKPAEIVHSGMIVGGAFLGSSHINEAHYESYGIKTDKYLMYYKGDKKNPIKRIHCSFDIPKNSVISKYCIREKLLLLENPDTKKLDSCDSKILYDSMKSGNKLMESHIIGKHLEQKFLTKEECEIIKSWIGGEIE